jgi:hypothetical protein
MDRMWLSEVWRYPVKSMAGEKLERTVIGPLGIPGDREIVVVDESGRIQDARARHLLLRHRATIAADGRVRIDVLHRIRNEFGGRIALNAWAARPGRIRVGDSVALQDAFDRAAAPRWGRFASR